MPPIKTRIDMLATGIKTPVGIKIAGEDLSVIQAIGEDIERCADDPAGHRIGYSRNAWPAAAISTVDIDRVAASRYGLNVADVQEIVRIAVGGMNVTESVEGSGALPGQSALPARCARFAGQAEDLPIVTPSGAQIALGDVAEIRISDGPGMIKSENARPNGWIYVDIEGRDLGSYVAEAQTRGARTGRTARPAIRSAGRASMNTCSAPVNACRSWYR